MQRSPLSGLYPEDMAPIAPQGGDGPGRGGRGGGYPRGRGQPRGRGWSQRRGQSVGRGQNNGRGQPRGGYHPRGGQWLPPRHAVSTSFHFAGDIHNAHFGATSGNGEQSQAPAQVRGNKIIIV